jgi:arylsulfatase A-like enzyme
MSSFLKPWWLSLCLNFLLAILLIADSEAGLVEIAKSMSSIALSLMLVMVATLWVYRYVHQNKKLRLPIITIAALSQTFMLYCSVVMINEFHHMPSLSEAGFLFSYPQYSFIMALERASFIGVAAFMLCFSVFLLSWLKKDKNWLASFDARKRQWAFSFIVLASLNLFFNSDNSQAMEMHYVQMLSKFVNEKLDGDSKVDVFSLNRLQLPSFEREDVNSSVKPNILIFRMEEVSRDSYGLYGEDNQRLTPFINNLEKRSPHSFFTFKNHVSNSGATETSTTLMYTGLKSNRLGSEFGHFPMIWDYANSAGYQTFMMIPFHRSWAQLDKKWASTPGRLSLDSFTSAENSGKPVRYDNSVVDSAIAEITIDWLDKRDRSLPFFGIVNIKLPHGNGKGVEELGYDNLGCPTTPARLNNYECAILVLDREMGKIVSELEKQGALDDTIIIGTSDHGADQFKHNKGRIYNYYQEVLAIPFFIRLPEKFQYIADAVNPNWRSNVSKITQNLDLLPTVVDLLEISERPLIQNVLQRLDGVSVFSELDPDRWVFSMNSNALRPWSPSGFAITIGSRYKYIYFEEVEELYDLQKDPDEMDNLLAHTESNLLRENGLVVRKDKEIEALYQEIKSYISRNRNAREHYVYSIPKSIDYDQSFKRTILGKDMPANIAEKKEGSQSLFSIDKKGILTHGVGLVLDEGHYEFKVRYSLKMINTQIHSSHYVLGYGENNKWTTLRQEVYPPGDNETLSVFVLIKPEHTDKHIAFASVYGGEGSLEIKQLDVLKLEDI